MIEAFIDTSFVVALVNEGDQFHESALFLSRQTQGSFLITTDCVLLEIGNSLARVDRSKAVQTIRGFLDSDEIEIIRLTDDLFASAFEMFASHADKTWGLVDCVSFVVMKDRGVSKALTNDRHFQQAGFEALLRLQ